MADTTATLVRAALALADAVADGVASDVYGTPNEPIGLIGEAREAIATAIASVVSTYGTTGQPLVARLRAVAARLLDLQRTVGELLETEELVLVSERSIIDLALELYPRDEDLLARAVEIVALNPTIPNPLRIAAGRTVVVYVR